MALITKMLKQVAVWWPVAGHDNHGRPVYGTPQNIKCFWIDTAQEFVDANGERRISQAQVFVGNDVGLMDVLWLGDGTTGTAQLNPPGDTDPYNGRSGAAWPVLRFDKTPNLKVTQFARIAML